MTQDMNNILQSINNILEYTKDLSKQDFSKNKMVQDAVIRNFEIIGEATKKVSDDYKQVHFEVPWKAYFGCSLRIASSGVYQKPLYIFTGRNVQFFYIAH
ncbi:MAG: HepT-like ribonuclease domain-containing protein [Bacteroidota bacterium]